MKNSNILVKVFTVNKRLYLYDANKNKVLEITTKVLNDINNYLYSPEYTSESITSLKRKGYLLNSNIERIEHPYTPIAEKLLQRNLSNLILQVTQRCNFRCRYCLFANSNESSRTHTQKSMAFDIAKKSIDLLSSNCADSRDLTISFYGGEPLLNFDLIKKAVEYSKSVIYNKELGYSMTTNFYIATDEMIDFLADNQFELLISLDGPEKTHNQHRRLSINGEGTYRTVIENVNKLQKRHTEYFHSHVQFNPVVFYDENPIEILDYFKNVLKVPESAINLHYVDNTGLHIAFDPIDLTIEETAQEIMDSTMIRSMKKALNRKDNISAQYYLNGSCVPGSEKLFVSVDGDFYPCEKVNECNMNMKIGSLERGFDYDNIKHLMNHGYLNQDNCKKCWAIRFCNLCCAHCDDGKSPLSELMIKNKCVITQKEVLRFLKKCVVKNQ